jgi:hypothetical protein
MNSLNEIVKCFIKYLNQDLRFIIFDFITIYFDIDELSISSSKSETNLAIVKRFCDLAKNSIMIKKWKNDKFKVVIEIFVYLLVLNKKNRVDYIVKNSESNLISSFHYVTFHEFRISEEFILFYERMSIFNEKANVII